MPRSLPYPHPTSANVSTLMRANRRSDTRLELKVRSLLHGRGLRFRKDLYIKLGDVRARPDVVFPRKLVAVFLDGCFWHGCPEHGHAPRVNVGYWGPKLERNMNRDKRVDDALRSAGWLPLRFWEHQPAEEIVERVVVALAQR